MNFIISIPVWGAWHMHCCLHTVLPSVFAALDHANAANRARFIIHTPSPDSLKSIMKGRNVRYLPLAAHQNEYLRFATSHKEVLYMAEDNECIIPLCADLILSREMFAFIEKTLSNGIATIQMLGPRTLSDPTQVPIGATATELMKWAIENAHQWTWENLYGEGQSRWPSTVYFKDENGMSCHAFHLHPIAIKKDRYLTFKTSSTIDDDLVDCFKKEEIYVVQNREIGLCDVSPIEKTSGVGNTLSNLEIAAWARGNASPMHRWFFKHRIVLTGTGANSQPIADSILETLNI